MQPYVFPYIGYFQLIRDADVFVVFDDVNFRKRSWITRNRILLNNAEHMFSLHLSAATSSKKINEIEIGDNRVMLLKTFRQAYTKAPYFNAVMPLIEELVLYDEPRLHLYLMHQLKSISSYFGLRTQFILSSSITKDNELKGQDKILAICKELDADHYTNAIGGQILYCEKDFACQGIDLKFVQSDYVKYQQFDNEFIPWLSIVDVMMFNSRSQIRDLLNAYQLVSGTMPT